MGGLVSRSVVGSQSISKSLRLELIQLYDNLERETVKFKFFKTEKDQSKRLFYLFQKDLSPGITGEILESKDQRDNITLKPVSQKLKFLAWLFLGVLDLGMLFYVFLFALSQDSHRQAAWGRSLGIYLLLDIVLISTLMVIFMHVLLPSLIMRDVGKIKNKITESIKEFYVKMDQEKEKEIEIEKPLKDQKKKKKYDSDDGNNSFDGKEDDSDDSDYDLLHLTRLRSSRSKLSQKDENRKQTETEGYFGNNNFNAAKYLFLSHRMAEQYPDLKASQIILQYSSPWPKQDYKHVKDVKKNYSDKYSGITRAISIIVIFFLTNLLATPLAIQDMILQICTTAAIGYTMLIHIQLYYIYPALVIIPTLAVIVLVFAVKHYYQRKRNNSEEEGDEATMELKGIEKSSSATVMMTMNRREGIKKGQVSSSASVQITTTAFGSAESAAATTRRQSLQLGLQLATRLKANIHESDEDDDDKEEELSEESEASEDHVKEQEDLEEHNQVNYFDFNKQRKEEEEEEKSKENSESLHFQFSDEEQEYTQDDHHDLDEKDFNTLNSNLSSESYPHPHSLQRYEDINSNNYDSNDRSYDDHDHQNYNKATSTYYSRSTDGHHQSSSPIRHGHHSAAPSYPSNNYDFHPNYYHDDSPPTLLTAPLALSYVPNYYSTTHAAYDSNNNDSYSQPHYPSETNYHINSNNNRSTSYDRIIEEVAEDGREVSLSVDNHPYDKKDIV
jgi:low affinity Fe/Cu permease